MTELVERLTTQDPMFEAIESSVQDGYIRDRRLSVAVFVLFFSWLLAFPFEGRILYALADSHGLSAHRFVFGAMVFHCAGLLLCGYFVVTPRKAKKLMLFSIAFAIAASCAFFFPPSFLWTAALFSSSFLAGGCVAAWGLFCINCAPKSDRFKIIADALIGSNLLMIVLNMAAVYLSPQAGLGLSALFLTAALPCALRLPDKEADISGERACEKSKGAPPPNLARSFAFLCLFILVVTINSGLMYQVQVPAFAHLEWLTSWYWPVPYIAALLIMRNLPRKTNRAYILYVAISMMGFSFIAFLSTKPSAVSFLIVNTLMMGACGVYDLFWWSILGDMLDMDKERMNPVKVLGFGLVANVLGVLLGGIIGNMAFGGNSHSFAPLTFGVVCVSLVMLPPLHGQLSALLKEHVFLTAFRELPPSEQNRQVNDFAVAENFTERENEVLALLVQGKTYKAVSEELRLAENTVKYHVKNIYSKTGVSNRATLMNVLLEERSSSGEKKR